MKATYIKPEVELVRVRLYSSVLEDTNVVVTGGSKESEWGQAAEGKEHLFEEDEEMFTRHSTTNVWGGFENIDDL